MRKSVALVAITVLSLLGVACGSSGGAAACASTLSVHDIALQHGTFVTTAYVTKGGGSSGGHSSSGGGSHSYKPPSNSGGKHYTPPKSSQHNSNTPSKSTQKISGSRSGSYKGPVSVPHSKYTYKAPGGVTHVYVHHTSSYYSGLYSPHTHWISTDIERFNPYNPFNYYNPFSPYYHVHLASC